MDYQEKLRLAKEALDSGSYDKETIEYIFPELKESEDGRMVKSLKRLVKAYYNINFPTPEGFEREDMIAWLEKHCEKFIPEDINEAALQYVDTCTVDGEITHDNVTEPYWNNHSMMNAYKAGWLEKQGEKINAIENFDSEFENQVSHLIASAINKEYEYNEGFVKWAANALLNYAKHELEKQGEQKPSPTLTWKHWKDGIGGNGEGKQVFLIKQNGYYSISSCLSFECDYIELSELDKLLKGEKQRKQKVPMIQWKGDNLKDVIEFTGKSPRFQEWFKTWDEYESYVHEHNNIFKLFDNDGNHWEVPIGAWIVKTPDGFNVPSRAIFKHKS